MSSIDNSSPRVLGGIAGQAVDRFSVVWNELKRGRSPMLPFFGDLPGSKSAQLGQAVVSKHPWRRPENQKILIFTRRARCGTTYTHPLDHPDCLTAVTGGLYGVEAGNQDNDGLLVTCQSPTEHPNQGSALSKVGTRT